jgi:hypothetical protein
MRKTYTKPQIMFENFTLSTNIAGPCEHVTKLPSALQCPYEDPELEVNVFVERANGCSYTVASGEHNGICYHIPSENYNLFGS